MSAAWRAPRASPASAAGAQAGRPGALPDLGRRLGAAAVARRRHHARREAGRDPAAAGLRRRHPRDQRRPQTHLRHQGRPTGAPGRAGRRGGAAALRRDRRRSGRDRLRPHRARCLHLRPRRRHPGQVRHPRPRSRGRARAASSRASRGAIPETPKPGDPLFRARAQRGGGQQPPGARRGCPRAPGELGYRTLVLASGIEGETREIARMHAAIAREMADPAARAAARLHRSPAARPPSRSRATAWAAATRSSCWPPPSTSPACPSTVVFSAGTDGTDGPTDAAGAIADGDTLRRNPDARAFLDAQRFLPLLRSRSATW